LSNRELKSVAAFMGQPDFAALSRVVSRDRKALVNLVTALGPSAAVSMGF
jgi:hypothetical protein